MKSDFEKELQRQPLRTVPGEWRAEILKAAQSLANSQLSALNSQPSSWWRDLLWPCPQAWAGLAAAWMIIFGLRVMAGSEPGSPTHFAATPASPEWREAIEEQRRLLTELLPPADPQPARHLEPADRPRSERRDERRFSNGQFMAPHCVGSFV